MDRIKRWKLSPSLVISLLALFLALSGSAVALSGKNRIDHNDLSKHVVHASKIHAGAVKTGKLADGAVVGEKIASGAVGGSKIADNAVGNAKLADSAVHAPQMGALVRVAETDTVPANMGRVLTATCPAGATAITGGYDATNAVGVTVPRSEPTDYGQAFGLLVNPTAWEALVVNDSGFAINFTVEVVCLIG